MAKLASLQLQKGSTRKKLEHFIKSAKCDDPLSPDWVPSIFSHIPATKKRKREKDMESTRCWTCATCCG
ncbi:unnamed protein product [Boreogadus saida]